ncbi:MAG TPA: DUF4390 domain-containing protein [Burkholderiaceae bacterium]|jgi:hypothetical protein
MTSVAPQHETPWPHAPRAAVARWRLELASLVLMLCAALLGVLAAPARAAEPEVASFEVIRNEEGVLLNYAIGLELTRSVDEALSKGVPLFFVAEAEVFRNRWYWRDQRVAHAVRVWRIVYQPLTSTYRVTFDGGLSQNYATKSEAFASISRGARWKIAETGQIDEGSHHYVEFNFKLDTSLLPRPLQIGIGGQADWALTVQRSQKIN